MRWIKRLALTLLLLLVVAGGVAGYAWYRSSSVPDWYAQAHVDASDEAEKSLLPTQNWLARTSAGNVDAKPEEAKRHTIELTDAQINTLLVKWSEAAGMSASMDKQVKDVRVRLENGRITVAGKMVEYDRVLSVVLSPVKSKEGVKLTLTGIWSGDQRLPLVALGEQQSQVQGGVARRAAEAREKLGIDSHGIATAATSNLYYTTLLADLFAGRQPDAFAFLNYNLVPGQTDPVVTRVTAMEINDGRLKMDIRMLSAPERQALIQHLRDFAAPDPTEAVAPQS